MATLHVELLMPDRSLWSGEAGMVIAKTIDGDIGIMPGIMLSMPSCFL